ncbi:MAG: YaiI/YqxD family protein [Hyphomicrobiaceae bacterium]
MKAIETDGPFCQNCHMKIYVDADACPVKDEIVRVSERHNLVMFFVSNQAGRLPRSHLIMRVVVSDEADAADNWIAERIGIHDICVTQDIQLAKRCLDAGARVIGTTGKPFDQANIGMALAMRDLRQHLREVGEGESYNAPFGRKNRSHFLQALENAVQATQRQREL